MSTVLHNTTSRRPSLGTIEAEGIKLGASCARQILEKPALPVMVARSIFSAEGRKVLDEWRATGDLPEGGYTAFEKGFDRGLEAQMKNPAATIEIKRI